MTEQEVKFLQQLQEKLQLQVENIDFQQNCLFEEAKQLMNQQLLINKALEKHEKEPSIRIELQHYLTKEQYNDYLASQSNPEMLCEFGITFNEWLNWFYEELPFLTKNKYLVFSDNLTIEDIPANSIVDVDHLNQEIYTYVGSQKVLFTLSGISLYYILSVQGRDTYVNKEEFIDIY